MTPRQQIYKARSLYRLANHAPGYNSYTDARRFSGSPLYVNPTKNQAIALACQVDQRAITVLGARPVEWLDSYPRQMFRLIGSKMALKTELITRRHAAAPRPMYPY